MAVYLENFIRLFYNPTPTYFYGEDWGGRSIYFWVYFVLCAAVVLQCAVLVIKRNSSQEEANEGTSGLAPFVYGVFGIGMICVILLQTISQVRYEMNPPPIVKEAEIADLQSFSEFCKSKIRGPQQAAFITDLNIDADPGMYFHRLLAYYLYPLDIRDVRPAGKNFILVYEAEDPLKYVPDDYGIIGIWNSKSLIAMSYESSFWESFGR